MKNCTEISYEKLFIQFIHLKICQMCSKYSNIELMDKKTQKLCKI